MSNAPRDLPDLPEPVAGALATYRTLPAANGPRWAERRSGLYPLLARYLRYLPMGDLIAAGARLARGDGPEASGGAAVEAALGGDLDRAFRDALGGRVPPGLIAVRLAPSGVRAEPGQVRARLWGERVHADVLLDSALDRAVTVWGPGGPHTVPAGGARFVPVELDSGPLALEVDGAAVRLGGLVRPASTAWLRLRSAEVCRWSVHDEDGTGWFPEGALRRWDAHGRAYFHGADARLRVPAGRLAVRVARGMDHGSAEASIVLGPGQVGSLALDPPRLRDPAAAGWYGGDLHLHMNYGGDQVCEPHHAAVMQRGEALHVMNMVAANSATSLVYDREALEAWAGRDLPWSVPGELIARMGAEYRSDLLGHLHGFGLAGPLPRHNAGHAESDARQDHPPNAAACAQMRRLGGVVCASHPYTVALGEDDPPDPVFRTRERSCDNRELVADAALGLVDAVDVLTHNSCAGTAVVYRRLLGAGLRLAATAGTDVLLSYSRCGLHSNPPGWARVYARLGGPLTAERFADAVRRGRTFATNGPWLELEVAGRGPGEVWDVAPGARLAVRARAAGPGVRRLRVRTARGVLSEAAAQDGEAEAVAVLEAGEPTYVVAEADGPGHPDVLDPRGPYAHSSPVYVDVAGRRAARPEDVRWCLDWLDRLEHLVRTRGVYTEPGALREMVEVIDQARAVYRARLAS